MSRLWLIVAASAKQFSLRIKTLTTVKVKINQKVKSRTTDKLLGRCFQSRILILIARIDLEGKTIKLTTK